MQDILKVAFKITTQNSRLQVLGLLLVGGMNIAVLHVFSQGAPWSHALTTVILRYSDLGITKIIISIAIGLIIIAIANVARILSISEILKLKFNNQLLLPSKESLLLSWLDQNTTRRFLEPKEVVKKHWKSFFLLSVSANFFAIVAHAALVSPQVLFNAGYRLASVEVLLVLAFIVALLALCMNMIPPLFIIVFETSLEKSLIWSWSFVKKRFLALLAFLGSLGIIYFVFTYLAFWVASYAFHVSISGTEPVIIFIALVFKALFVWMVLGFLNAFTNSALLLWFLSEISPIRKEMPQGTPASQPL